MTGNEIVPGVGAGSGAGDQDPFLTFSTQSHYGNIIVNVNNGVQCVRATDIFQRDMPPPYSEVANKSEEHPPPPYSTIDRNNKSRVTGSACSSGATSKIHIYGGCTAAIGD
nr:hypothetical protein BaRGS_011604 [Batillaria attramentaria]